MKKEFKLLRQQSPSVIRNTLLMWVLLPVGYLLGLGLVVLGVAMALGHTVGYDVMKLLLNNTEIEKNEAYAQISFITGIAMIIIGVLFYLISWMARRLIRRNYYIMDLEKLIDEAKEVEGEEEDMG